MDLLRFLTAGSVDDGKSTLIGRLLYDSNSLLQDQLEAIERSSQKNGGKVNLALLTDGLKAEREQGITIDVAYKYFSTPHRKFIIADAPGHIQYTRNMITGASNCDLMIILIDARNGVSEQTYRHSFIASLLRIPNIVVCINKMDLVDYAESRFIEIKKEFEKLQKKLNFENIKFIPISAFEGDNVVNISTKMKWYREESLLHFLENVSVSRKLKLNDFRFPVQYVIRPENEEFHDYRGYAGQVKGGEIEVGDSVKVLPSGHETKIRSILFYNQELKKATDNRSVTIELEDDIDISRGDFLVTDDQKQIKLSQEIECFVCWMDKNPLTIGSKYLIRLLSSNRKCIIQNIEFVLNINNLEKEQGVEKLQLNDIAKIKLKVDKLLVFDDYENNKHLGSFILIDDRTNNTVGACVITSLFEGI